MAKQPEPNPDNPALSHLSPGSKDVIDVATDLVKDAATDKKTKEAAALARISAAAADRSASELRTGGQRRVNLLWEANQAIIALIVTGTAMYTAALIALRKDANADSKAMAITAFALISNAAFLVIGFYFGRTNHQRTGGVGPHGENETR